MSHVIFEMVLCLIESIIVALITYFSCVDNIPSEGVCFPIVVELSISFFIIIFSSDVLGLMVSSIVKNPNTAMTVMPFILIIQLIMSGMIFELEGVTEAISKITIAKWGLNAICTTANVNAMEFSFPDLVSDYKYTTGHLMSLWVLLLAFAALYAILAIISLKFIDKDKR